MRLMTVRHDALHAALSAQQQQQQQQAVARAALPAAPAAAILTQPTAPPSLPALPAAHGAAAQLATAAAAHEAPPPAAASAPAMPTPAAASAASTALDSISALLAQRAQSHASSSTSSAIDDEQLLQRVLHAALSAMHIAPPQHCTAEREQAGRISLLSAAAAAASTQRLQAAKVLARHGVEEAEHLCLSLLGGRGGQDGAEVFDQPDCYEGDLPSDMASDDGAATDDEAL